VRHQGGRYDGVAGARLNGRQGSLPVEVLIEEVAPLLNDEMSARILRFLAGELALRVSINDQEASVVGFAALAGTLQLAGVEGPIAAAAHDDHVTERNLTE
jgi:hypothetical protein